MQTACQGVFIIVLTVFSLSWFFSKIKKYFAGSVAEISAGRVADTEPDTLENYRNKQDECRQRMQEEHESKALHQKERIRKLEEERRHKKQKEFYKFSDGVFLTEGAVLGHSGSASDDDSYENNDTPEGRQAASKRKVLEQINERYAAKLAATTAARQKPKRVITLPEEPDVSEDGVITVILRTPIGTVCQRRFYTCDSVQTLLDYITTQGFSQTRYTVSTSYPRQLLENPHHSLLDYNFGKRVTLNIEEKD